MAPNSPHFRSSNNLKYLKLGYRYFINNLLVLLLVPAIVGVGVKASLLDPKEILQLFEGLGLEVPHVAFLFVVLVFTLSIYYFSRPRAVYLVDFACFTPPVTCRVPYSTFMEHARFILRDPKSVQFVTKMLERSGLGEETCLPPATHYIPPQPTMEASRSEAELVIFDSLDSLLRKTNTNPKQIDILIVNCSLFSPTPSLSAMIVNRYKLRSNVLSFNLSGMGCSAGLISVDLARRLLQSSHPDSTAVVVSTEIITPNYYSGKERAMLLPNCLFRMGCAALLLTNKSSYRRSAKYSLRHVVRTHLGSDDAAFRCVHETEDSEGNVGISLSKDLMSIAGDALRSNITTIGPLVLPASEQLLFLISFLAKKLLPNRNRKPYVPDFKEAFEHFCIHAGGRAVIDELQKSLALSAEHVEASRMTLHRFGNTSSSSLWYEMAYIEAKGRMKKGDRVWQIAFGSGFKCNSAVWRCNRTIEPSSDGPWVDCIDRYPVHVPEVVRVLSS